MRRPGSGVPSSLARLLVDLPGERLAALGQVWSVGDAANTGRVPALYRRMTNSDARDAVVSRHSDAARMIFHRLKGAKGPVTQREILRALPFAEDVVTAALAGLETDGLIWSVQRTGREQAALDRRWFVPSEVAESTEGIRRPRGVRSSRLAHPQSISMPPLAVVAELPPRLRRSGTLPKAVSALHDLERRSPEQSSSIGSEFRAYAMHCATELGVRAAESNALVPGPRLAAWHKLSLSEQVRALARLWLVDDRSPRAVQVQVRRALWHVLAHAEPGKWYDVGSLARAVAWAAAFDADRSGSGETPRLIGAARSLARRDLERALETLRWIGALAIADDDRGRMTAVSLTELGRGALDPLDSAGR